MQDYAGEWKRQYFRNVCWVLLFMPSIACAGELGAPGDLYIVSSSFGHVKQFDTHTSTLVGVFAEVAGNFGAAFGPNGNLFVAYIDPDFGGAVRELDGQTGDLVGVFVSPGTGGLDLPAEITFGPNGNLFVASENTDEVIEYDGANGTLVGTFASGGGLDAPGGIAFGPNGNLFVVSKGSHVVIEYDGTTGALIGTFVDDPDLSNPWCLTFGPNGNLFVTNVDNDIWEFDGATGASRGVFASANGFSYDGWDLAFGANGNLFVTFRVGGGGDPDEVVEFNGSTGERVRVFANMVNPRYLTFKPCPAVDPDIVDFIPSEADDCGRLWDASITGSSLWPSCMANVNLRKSGQPRLYGAIVGGSGDSKIVAHFDLAGAVAGGWTLNATNAFGVTDSLGGALTVTSPPSCPAPVITGFASPFGDDLAYNCRELENAVIAGTDIEPEATVILLSPDDVVIDGTDVEVRSPGTSLLASLDLTGVAPGAWEVVVTNPDGQQAVWPIEVESCPRGRPGDFYVANEINKNVLQYDTNGNLVCDFVTRGDGGLNFPYGLVWGPNGNLFVSGLVDTNPVAGAVWEFDGQTGAFIRMFVPPLGGGLRVPGGLDFGAADGNLYVLDNNKHDGGIMRVYDRHTGEFLRSFALGERDQHGCRLDASGRLFVGEETNGFLPVLEEWDPIAGVKVADVIFPEPGDGLTEIRGFIRQPHTGHWLVTYWFAQVRKYNRDTGALLDIPVDYNGDPTDLVNLFDPRDLAIGPDGNLFVSSRFTYNQDIASSTGAIHKYDGSTFEPLDVIGMQTVDHDDEFTIWYPNGLEFKPLPGDFGGKMNGGDWDVDLADFAALAARMTGPSIETVDAHGLIAFDTDRDSDLDLYDYAGFQREFGASLQSTGACCETDGTCTDSVWLPLCDGGATYQGDSSTCADVTCPPPGACCLPDATCAELTGAYCEFLDGIYQGELTICAGTDCPSGACCFDSGECAESLDIDCAGTYQGDGTSCAAESCPEPCPALECDGNDEGEPFCQVPDNFNGGCNYDPPVFSTITCGDVVCGQSHANGNFRDTDWYELIVTEDIIADWTVTSEFDMVIGLIETVPLGSDDCDDRTGFINPFALGDPCETRGGPLPFVLTPGTYWFFVSTQDFDGFPCDQGPWEYTANLTCTPAIGRLGAPSENDWQAGKSKGAQSTQQ